MDADISRRNILTVLGIAAAGAPAFASEQMNSPLFDTPGVPGMAFRSLETQRRFAEALEKAAAAIRRGELYCCKMDIASEVKLEDWFEHKVTFTFELPMTPAKPDV
jgi:hypothetical protein